MESWLDTLSVHLKNASLWAYGMAYLGGLLISFTPCVYPILPITIATIGAHGHPSRWRGLALSLIYTIGMALTYTALGLMAALSGKLFGQIQSHPWTFLIVANLCLLMGLSMLGIFTFPARAFGFAAKAQPRRKPRGPLGIFVIGAASGLVMGPCTTPVLAVLLGYVASTQKALQGMALLFLFSFGMGTSLLLVGTFTGLLTSLPRSGVWMQRISHLCGWILLVMGEYFLIQAGRNWI